MGAGPHENAQNIRHVERSRMVQSWEREGNVTLLSLFLSEAVAGQIPSLTTTDLQPPSIYPPIPEEGS